MAVGSLAVRVSANTRPYQQGMRGTRRPAQDLQRQMRAVARRAAVMTTALAAAGAAITANLVRAGMQAIDEQAKLARSLDGTIDGLRGYTEAAQDAGISSEIAAREAQTLSGRLAEAARRGAGPASEALDRLGLSAQELMRMDVDERMAAIADRMREMGMSTSEARDELRQLGIRNREMASLMTQGGDAIRDAREEIERYGLSISDVDAANVERANDAMRRIGRVVEVVRQRLAIALAPVLEHMANLFNEAAQESGGFRDQIDRAIQMGVRGFAMLADAIEGVRRAFLIVGNAAATTFAAMMEGALSAAHVVVTGPIEALNALIRQMNRIPGVTIEELGMSGIGRRIEQELELAQGATREGMAEINRILMEPMPSVAILDAFDDIQEKARQTSEETIHQQRRAAEALSLDPAAEMPDDDQEAALDAERERMRELMEARAEELRRGMMEETELEKTLFADRMHELAELRENEAITMWEHMEMLQHLQQEHDDRLSEIQARGEKDRHDEIARFARANAAIRENAMRQETAALRSGLQTMFGDHKAFGEALGGLKRLEAIMSAYAWGASQGGPVAGAAAAAAAGAAQLSTLNSMRGQSFGGGSSQPAAGSTTAPAQPAGGGVDRTFTVETVGAGDMIQGETFRALMRQIEEASEDGLTRIRLV